MLKFRHGFKARANDIALGLRKQAGLAHVLFVHAAEVVCTGELARRTDSLVEAEAACLGGCILVPNQDACPITFSGLDSHTSAKSCGGSEEMITYRLGMIGALKQARVPLDQDRRHERGASLLVVEHL